MSKPATKEMTNRAIMVLTPSNREHQKLYKTLRNYANTEGISISHAMMRLIQIGLIATSRKDFDLWVANLVSADMTASKSAFDVGRLYEESPLAKTTTSTTEKSKVRKTKGKGQKAKSKRMKKK